MKKKIIFISEALWIGGIETALVNLLNNIDYENYDVTCLIIRDYQNLVDRVPSRCRLVIADRQHMISFKSAYKFKRIYNLMEEPHTSSGFRRIVWKLLCTSLKAPEVKLFAKYIQAEMSKESFDTCVIFSNRTAEVAVRGIKADKYLMYYHHGNLKREYHDGIGYKKSEKIIAVSEGVASILKEEFPQYEKKITVVRNLIDIKNVIEKSEEVPKDIFPKSKINIVSCGRLHKDKGYDLAVQSCAILVKNGYTNLQWHIIGGGPDENRIKQLIQDTKMEKYIHLYGMKDNPYPYIKAADLFVQPSLVEAFGLSIMEALVLGVPVIATATSGALEISDMISNLILCDISSEHIAEKISEKISSLSVTSHNDDLDYVAIETLNRDTLQKLYQLL